MTTTVYRLSTTPRLEAPTAKVRGWQQWVPPSAMLACMTAAVFLGINTAPDTLRRPASGWVGEFHRVRTLFPIGVLLLGLLVAGSRAANELERKRSYSFPAGLRLWGLYGLVSVIGAGFSPRPVDALYWSANYLAVIMLCLVAMNRSRDADDAARFNRMAWLVSFAALALIAYVARGSLLAQVGEDVTGYGIINRQGTVGGMAMTRSSGLARLASIPALFGFVYLIRSRGLARLGFLVVTGVSTYLVIAMQSRGALVALAGAFGLAAMCAGRTTKRIGLLLLMVMVFGWLAQALPGAGSVKRWFERGQTRAELMSLTGRTHTWRNAWREIGDAPLLGRGMQADRILLRQHVHNTYLYGLLTAGFLGTACFILGLGWAWWALLDIWRSEGESLMLACVAGLLCFFTLRGIPEVSGTLFGVDLYVMAPMLLWIGMKHQEVVAARHDRVWVVEREAAHA